MARGGRGIGEFFTFGGRVPAGLGVLLAAVLAGSVYGWVDQRFPSLAALSPVAIARGELWRLLTWPLVNDLLGLLFGGYMLYNFGRQLAWMWGEGRLVARFLALTLGSAIAATLLSLLWAPASSPHGGMWPVVMALVFAWALQNPDRPLSFFGVLPFSGKTLARLIVFGTVLFGIASGRGLEGIGGFVPHLSALGIAWLLEGRRGGGDGLRRAKAWWRERERQRRARHLKVVGRNGSGERPRWMN